MRLKFRKFMKIQREVTFGTLKMRLGLALRAMFKYMACRDGLFPFLEKYYSSPVANLQKSECIFFAKILHIFDHSSEFNRWIWLRLIQDKVKILKNVLPEAQLLENSVAKVMRGSRSGS